MADITVGLLNSIGVVTNETFTPDMVAFLERDFSAIMILEKDCVAIGTLEKDHKAIGTLEKEHDILALLERKLIIKGDKK